MAGVERTATYAGRQEAPWQGLSGLLHTLAGRKHHVRGGDDCYIRWQAGSIMAGMEWTATYAGGQEAPCQGWRGLLHTLADRKHHGRGGVDCYIRS